VFAYLGYSEVPSCGRDSSRAESVLIRIIFFSKNVLLHKIQAAIWHWNWVFFLKQYTCIVRFELQWPILSIWYTFHCISSEPRGFIQTCELEKFNISREWLWVNFYISRKVTSIYSYIQLLKPLQTKSIEIDLKNCSRASSRAKLI